MGRVLECHSTNFFTQDSDEELFLSVSAAIDVCRLAAEHGLVIARIEGGVFREGKFMPRVACIWDGSDPPVSKRLAERNNREACEFILSERSEHNAFVVTAPPISGWPHRDQ